VGRRKGRGKAKARWAVARAIGRDQRLPIKTRMALARIAGARGKERKRNRFEKDEMQGKPHLIGKSQHRNQPQTTRSSMEREAAIPRVLEERAAMRKAAEVDRARERLANMTKNELRLEIYYIRGNYHLSSANLRSLGDAELLLSIGDKENAIRQILKARGLIE